MFWRTFKNTYKNIAWYMLSCWNADIKLCTEFFWVKSYFSKKKKILGVSVEKLGNWEWSYEENKLQKVIGENNTFKRLMIYPAAVLCKS